jgi:hypothetical protein
MEGKAGFRKKVGGNLRGVGRAITKESRGGEDDGVVVVWIVG